jgi:hypothetical protein
LSLFKIYLVSLLGSGFLATASSIFSKYSHGNLSLNLIGWLLIRFLSDILAFLLILKFGVNNFPVFHVSILIEGVLILNYFHEHFVTKMKYRIFLFLIPILIFILETKVFGSIFSSNRISFMSYNLLTSITMFLLIFNTKKIKQNHQPVIKSIFVFHTISFIYSISENIIRVDKELMTLILPIFLFSTVCLNLFITYQLWSVRKS